MLCNSIAYFSKPAESTFGVNPRSLSLFQGVIEFSLCLLFAKLVSYTFLFWLPLYITNVGEYLLVASQLGSSAQGLWSGLPFIHWCLQSWKGKGCTVLLNQTT